MSSLLTDGRRAQATMASARSSSIGAASPAFMVAAVVLTGNHYVVDAALGAIVALTGLWLADRLAAAKRDTELAELVLAPTRSSRDE